MVVVSSPDINQNGKGKFNRRDFLKVSGVGLGAMAFKPPKLDLDMSDVLITKNEDSLLNLENAFSGSDISSVSPNSITMRVSFDFGEDKKADIRYLLNGKICSKFIDNLTDEELEKANGFYVTYRADYEHSEKDADVSRALFEALKDKTSPKDLFKIIDQNKRRSEVALFTLEMSTTGINGDSPTYIISNDKFDGIQSLKYSGSPTNILWEKYAIPDVGPGCIKFSYTFQDEEKDYFIHQLSFLDKNKLMVVPQSTVIDESAIGLPQLDGQLLIKHVEGADLTLVEVSGDCIIKTEANKKGIDVSYWDSDLLAFQKYGMLNTKDEELFIPINDPVIVANDKHVALITKTKGLTAQSISYGNQSVSNFNIHTINKYGTTKSFPLKSISQNFLDRIGDHTLQIFTVYDSQVIRDDFSEQKEVTSELNQDVSCISALIKLQLIYKDSEYHRPWIVMYADGEIQEFDVQTPKIPEFESEKTEVNIA